MPCAVASRIWLNFVPAQIVADGLDAITFNVRIQLAQLFWASGIGIVRAVVSDVKVKF